MMPSFDYENQYWAQGIQVVAGIDEVGMGALAGPVVAGAVIFEKQISPPTPPFIKGGEKAPYVVYKQSLRAVAQELRRNMTPAEKALWDILRHATELKAFSFLRQKPLDRFIADFYCAKLMLVIEVDGDVHANQKEYDAVRSEELLKYGIQVIRFKNEQVLDNPDTVKKEIINVLGERSREFGLTPLDKRGQGGFEFIRDSKTLSSAQREKAAGWIKANARAWALGEASVEEINELNIRRASHLAMRRAIEALGMAPDILLIDGLPAAVHPTIPAEHIIKGDSLSFSIAAASILAKVYRDNVLAELDKSFPAYGFAQHKGYGSPVHLSALQAHGATIHHRRAYAPVAAALTKLSSPVSL